MAVLSGLLGVFSVLLIAFALSSNRKAINIRTVLGAFFLQVMFALLVLYVPFGQEILGSASSGVAHLINAGQHGIAFVFGDLAHGKVGFIFAVSILTIIIFTSSLVSVLYYLKIIPVFINTVGYGIHKMLGTSRAESFSATANIFMGQTEAPLVVKPFINTMTKSELFAVMVGGLGSVAGGVLVGYASLGIDIKYLIAASFMAAPGSLLMAKIIMPETEVPKQTLEDVITEKDEKPHNIVEAAANGAGSGLYLALNVGAMLVAFIGLVALADIILGGIGDMLGFENLTFKLILGYAFSPLAFLLGVPLHEAIPVGALLGEKIIFNEFVAYISLTQVMANLSPHSVTIATFALCGFANIGSIGILIGGLGTLAPKQRSNIAQLAVKGIIAGSLSNFMSAALAGIFTSF